MTDPVRVRAELYRLWADDADHLARIGATLATGRPGSVVSLPIELAAVARAAWDRDDGDGDLGVETAVERQIRDRAAALALIGAAVAGRGRRVDAAVEVDLSPELVTQAIDASGGR